MENVFADKKRSVEMEKRWETVCKKLGIKLSQNTETLAGNKQHLHHKIRVRLLPPFRS